MTAKTKSFIHEFQLKLKPGQERFLLVRLDCARQLYNACLGESLRRLKSMRESRDFKKALNLGKGKQRTSAFNALNELFGFREFDLHAYATAVRNSCHIGVHLNSDACQKTASRAFKAVKEYSVGKRGRPRFKGKGQFDSIEGKGNRCIIWDGEVVEKVSYLSWQRNFGRSVNFRAPGMFVEMLRRKAESAGGKIFEVPTALRLSQTCHGCEKIKKKHLSQRWHDCECGIHVQRDIMSAFLAMTLKIGKGRDGNTYRLDYDYTRKVWSGVESLLKHAVIKT